MLKKKYDVHGTVPAVVHITVEADNGDQAIEIAEKIFRGVKEYAGNGGVDKLMKQYKSPSRAGETNKCWRR